MEIGLVKKVNIEEEMQHSYLDYAMSVIVSRAIPDARDGLKPVQRRILFAMHDMGIGPGSLHKKSARIVGEVLGKYHPHGDMAVYEAMARMAQDFSLRYPLVDGQGNFGSIDGDPPAAMRYTEAKLFPLATEILADIDKNTVRFLNNFDESMQEPEVLPAAFPNLLVNGSSGIAVGMATNIPPHNLGEILDAMNFLLGKWDHLDDINIEDLMHYVKGPDYPTGGIILQEGEEHDLINAYATGRGRALVRGRVQVEEMGRGRDRIIITELPYMTNKSSLVERIAELAREGGLEGIADLRDESDRQGMRIVIELKQGADTNNILRELYKRTPLQTTISINMLALVGGEPRLMTLKQGLRVYLEHRLEVVKRRSEYELSRAKARQHILEGLRIAINNIDEIINIIRNSSDTEDAKKRLIKKYKLSDIQVHAILDMPLRKLASLERKKIEIEYKELLKTIKELESLLHSFNKMRDKVSEELLIIREKYSDKRRTQIVYLKPGESSKELLTTKALTPAHTVWIGITSDGIIARVTPENLNRVSGKQSPILIIKTNTHHTAYIVDSSGHTAAISVEAIPEVEKISDGIKLEKVSPLVNEAKLAGIFTIPQRDEIVGERFIMTISRMGMVKKSSINDLPGASSQGFNLSKVNSNDEITSVLLLAENNELIMTTAMGMAIRFNGDEVRSMGLAAVGVNGIKLGDEDFVIGAESVNFDKFIGIIANDGTAWRVPVKDFPIQGRYGQGVIACRLKSKSNIAAILVGKNNQTGLINYQRSVSKNLRMDDIPEQKRSTVGKLVFDLKENDFIKSVTPIRDSLSYWSEKLNEKIPAKRNKKNDLIKNKKHSI